jgi:hypothetical protein
MRSIRPHIVLEGPDGSGKTTLAQYLVKNWGYRYVHQGQPTHENMLVEYARIFLEEITQDLRPVVFDRLHVGELVYGPLFRGRDRMFGLRGLKLLNMLLVAKGARTIFCMPPYEVVRKNWVARLKIEMVKEEKPFQEVYERYRDFLSYADHVYDYSQPNGLGMALNKISWRSWFADNDLIGDPGARVVLLGDQPNQELDLPFFATDHSSGFFHDCLTDAGYTPRDILLGNCYTPQGSPRDILKGLNGFSYGPRIIAALGNRAKNAVLAIQKSLPPRTTVVGLEHPQYIKRFKINRRDQYVRNLAFLRHIPAGDTYRGIYVQ